MIWGKREGGLGLSDAVGRGIGRAEWNRTVSFPPACL